MPQPRIRTDLARARRVGREGPVASRPVPLVVPELTDEQRQTADALTKKVKQGNHLKPTGYCQHEEDGVLCRKPLPGERKFCGYHLAMRNR